MAARPTAAELEAARDKPIEDLIAPGLEILFVGINPGLYSGATGHHFARPGNRFWRAIHEAGLTSSLLSPDRQGELLTCGIGITNLVNRTTARADELTADELRAGAETLTDKVERYEPAKVAFLGVSRIPRGLRRTERRSRPPGASARRQRGVGTAQPERPECALLGRGAR